MTRYKTDLQAGDRFPPLIVRRRNKTGGFVLLSGMHRWHAARELGWPAFPAYIVRCTPAVGRLISFDANRTHGKALSASELGELEESPELADFTRARVRKAAGHLLGIGQAIDSANHVPRKANA